MRKNNFKKAVFLIALLLLCQAAASCRHGAEYSDTDGVTEPITVQTETEAIPPDTEEILEEFDLNGYMNLSRSSDSDRRYSYLRKSDIMAFDALANDLGVYDIAYRPAFSFHYAICGEEKSLFGLPGYIFYIGGSDMGELAPNVVAGTEPSPLYDEYYVYVGNGDDLKYDGLYFTAINLSLDDYAHVLTSIADMANVDASSIELILADENGYRDWKNPTHPTHLNELAERLNINDTTVIVDQVTLDVDTNPSNDIIIPKNDEYQWRITIYWRYWEKFMRNYGTFENYCSWDEEVVNQIEIRIYCESISDESTTDTSADSEPQLSLPYDTSAEELCQKIHEREIPHSEAVFYPAFQDDVVWEFSRYTTLPVTWEDLCYTVNDVGDKWQYTFWYTNEPTYVIVNGCAVLSCRDSAGNVSYQISWEQTPYLVCGPYSAGDPLIDGYADFSSVDGYWVINRNALVAVLEDQIDLSKYQIQYGGIQLRNDMIFVPLLCDDRCFYADIGIDTSLNYIFRSLDEVDIDEISPHDFIIKYRAFGLSPLELMECGISHPLNPENLLSAYLDSDGIVDPSVYIGSEFLFEPYIRVRTDDTDVTYYLIHRRTGQSMAIADITENIGYEDLYWGIS